MAEELFFGQRRQLVNDTVQKIALYFIVYTSLVSKWAQTKLSYHHLILSSGICLIGGCATYGHSQPWNRGKKIGTFEKLLFSKGCPISGWPLVQLNCNAFQEFMSYPKTPLSSLFSKAYNFSTRFHFKISLLPF